MTEMDENSNEKVFTRSSSTSVKSRNSDYFISSPAPRFRFLIYSSRHLRPDIMQDHSTTRASVIHPIGGERHQESCRVEPSSRQTERQIPVTTIQSESKSIELDDKESTSPLFQPEQSLVRRAIRFLIILFTILGLFYVIMMGSQAGYPGDYWIQKVRFGKFTPPV